MSQKKEKAKRKAEKKAWVEKAAAVEGVLAEVDEILAPVTAKEMAQANERVRLCEQVFEQTQAKAREVLQNAQTSLQAARNEQDKLAARVREEDAKEPKDGTAKSA